MPLTHAEEIALAERIAQGDQAARDELILANLGLVGSVAKHFLGRGMDFDDLVSEGNLGLIEAAKRFDPMIGTKFSTYANIWIKHAIRRALLERGQTIRVPAHMARMITKWARTERALEARIHRSVTFAEIADEMGLDEEKRTLVRLAFQARRTTGDHVGALDRPTDSLDREIAEQERAQETAERSARLRAALPRLRPRDQAAISLWYGLGGEKPMSGREVGARIGTSHEWARHIKMHAINRLKTMLA